MKPDSKCVVTPESSQSGLTFIMAGDNVTGLHPTLNLTDSDDAKNRNYGLFGFQHPAQIADLNNPESGNWYITALLLEFSIYKT